MDLNRPWITLACCCLLACATALDNGTVYVDLVFPRNETYAPSPLMPIVFGYANSHLAVYLEPSLTYTVWGPKHNWTGTRYAYPQLNFADWSPDPFIADQYATDIKTEGSWSIYWVLSYRTCVRDDSKANFLRFESHSFSGEVAFTIENSSSAMNLTAGVVAANAHDSCLRSGGGFAIDIADALPDTRPDSGNPGHCAVAATTTPEPSSCGVTLDAAAASGVAYRADHDGCDPGEYLETYRNVTFCSTIMDNSGTRQSAFSGVPVLAAICGMLGVFGGLGFI